MTAKDASPPITIPQTTRNDSVFSANHGNARMMTTENRETRRKRDQTITSAAIVSNLKIIQKVTRHKLIKRVET